MIIRTLCIQLLLSVVTICASSCEDEMLSPKQYIKWVEEKNHGFMQVQETPEYRYSLLYKPKPYLVLKSQPDAGKNQASFIAAEKTFEDLNYVSLWFETPNSGDPVQQGKAEKEVLEQRIHYCSFDIQQDLVLLEGSDTLRCVFAHWERLGSITSRQHFILAFEKSRHDPNADKLFVFKNHLQEEDIVQFHIRKEVLKKIPSLQF